MGLKELKKYQVQRKVNLAERGITTVVKILRMKMRLSNNIRVLIPVEKCNQNTLSLGKDNIYNMMGELGESKQIK